MKNIRRKRIEGEGRERGEGEEARAGKLTIYVAIINGCALKVVLNLSATRM